MIILPFFISSYWACIFKIINLKKISSFLFIFILIRTFFFIWIFIIIIVFFIVIMFNIQIICLAKTTATCRIKYCNNLVHPSLPSFFITIHYYVLVLIMIDFTWIIFKKYFHVPSDRNLGFVSAMEKWLGILKNDYFLHTYSMRCRNE